ncbi:MAG: diguanylate cyclase [Phenylobacterium sp.]|uniref:GGDEF domain-containing protein n=1 Tax=Phenylobacterium sp. TaxID=1871053 RepID=UPI002732323C|nr:GGDEF domain-containing protein [Phenylobacterium sp.]MDP3174345.1 diguanylate cyclase [Phenylobacterium sp.]
MSGDVETMLRGPGAFEVARRALEEMERHRVWPTALNFELWTHVVVAPDGALAREIARLIDSGEAFTDTVSDELAATYLPKARLNDHIRDAGDALSKELASVSKAIQTARKSSEVYGKTLASASRVLDDEQDPAELRQTIATLTAATRRVHKENRALEERLEDSTNEVNRLREHLEQVRRDATTDGLTNLANRKAFDDELDRACDEADEGGWPLTLAVIDIDHFKSFNDTWGHQTGDQVLRFVASVIGKMGSAPRVVARYGGEEFALLFPNETAASAFAVLETIRREVSSRMLKRRSTNEDLGTVSVSAGLAERRPGEQPPALMERADEALYASKHRGRNRTTSAEDMANAA